MSVELLHFDTGHADIVSIVDIDLPVGGGTTVFFCPEGQAISSSPVEALTAAPTWEDTSSAISATCKPFDEILNATGAETSFCAVLY
eukprot:COSAG06_NODE_813_length_12161_cov_3.785193_10_plen_87_part_00